jgi:hypothetical protein
MKLPLLEHWVVFKLDATPSAARPHRIATRNPWQWMYNGTPLLADAAGAHQGMAACVVHARSHVSGAWIGCGRIHHHTLYFVNVSTANRRAGERSLLGPAPLNSRRPMYRAAHLSTCSGSESIAAAAQRMRACPACPRPVHSISMPLL